jgi:hypothetical protein
MLNLVWVILIVAEGAIIWAQYQKKPFNDFLYAMHQFDTECFGALRERFSVQGWYEYPVDFEVLELNRNHFFEKKTIAYANLLMNAYRKINETFINEGPNPAWDALVASHERWQSQQSKWYNL